MIRDTLSSLISRPAARAVASPVREMVDEILASRSFASPDDIEALRNDLESLRTGGTGEVDARMAGLEQEVASLKKKLSMAMGALQAATAQLAEARRATEEAVATARQATQQATSALATAESAVEGAEQLEAKLAALERPAPAKRKGKAEPEPEPASEPVRAAPEEMAADSCAVPDCTGKLRARGFCARHYQQWKRGTLEGFPNEELG